MKTKVKVIINSGVKKAKGSQGNEGCLPCTESKRKLENGNWGSVKVMCVDMLIISSRY